MESRTDERRTLKTIENACNIVLTLQKRNGAGVTELAEEFDVGKGTMHTYLSTLREEGIVIQDTDNYYVSLKLFEIGGRVRNRQPIYEYGCDSADSLAVKSGELVHLGLKQRGQMNYIYQANGSDAMKTTTPVGFTRPMHGTAGGKAILATLDEDQANDIIDDCEFEQLTEHTISDREELLAELETVREQGYALSDEEEVVGARTVATTVISPNGNILGAICLSGPVSRFEGEYLDKMVALVKETANHIEVNVQRT